MEGIRLPQFDDAAAEQDFWHHHDTQMYPMRVFFLLLSLVIYIALAILDISVGGDSMMAMLVVRGIGAVLFLFSIIMFTRSFHTVCQRERALEFCALSSSCTQLILIILAPSEATGHYEFGLGVIMSVGALMLVPRFSTVARVLALVITAYVTTVPWHSADMLETIVSTLFILLIALAVLIGSFERERLARKQAIMSAALAKSNAELQTSRHEALTARDEAIAANTAKNRFLASVSHELRTPMNAILGFSGMMRSEIFGPMTTPKYAEYIEHIHSSGLLLQTNIDDLLDLARLEVGKIGWVDETFSLDSVLENVVATCRTAAKGAGVSIRLSRSNRDTIINADPTRLTQAVINLVTNAVKFSEDGQSVTIQTTRSDNGDCLIHVVDTGCGMSPADLEKVRMPFAQAHADSYSKGKGGLGLGLAIVAGIVTTMEGQLDLKSETGAGTTATLVVPAFRITDVLSDVA